MRERYANSRLTHSNACNDPRKHSMIVCYMNKENKIPNIFDDKSENDDQEKSSKRNVFRRMRDKISTSFSGNKKGNDSQNEEGEGDGELLYKPNPLDVIRLNLARAMSGVSNLPFFSASWE